MYNSQVALACRRHRVLIRPNNRRCTAVTASHDEPNGGTYLTAPGFPSIATLIFITIPVKGDPVFTRRLINDQPGLCLKCLKFGNGKGDPPRGAQRCLPSGVVSCSSIVYLLSSFRWFYPSFYLLKIRSLLLQSRSLRGSPGLQLLLSLSRSSLLPALVPSHIERSRGSLHKSSLGCDTAEQVAPDGPSVPCAHMASPPSLLVPPPSLE
jgi:hypothetical protein